MTNKDVGESLKWYALAGIDINGTDLCHIGYAYDVGSGIRINKSKAVEFYRKAAEKGDSEAQYYLGRCFENGSGVTRNLDLARYWYGKAAIQGNSLARQCMPRIASKLHNQKLLKSFEQFFTSLIIGPTYGGVGFFILQGVLDKSGIHIPLLGSSFFPANLLFCIVTGFIIIFLIIKINSNSK